MSDLVYCIATRGWEGWKDCVHTWLRTADDHHAIYVVSDRDVMPSFQDCYELTKAPVLAYIHDDVEIYEKGWDTRVLRQFLDGGVGLVGIAGGVGHCSPSLYTTEYRVSNLARQSFVSNLRDAEKHGSRFAGERDVAVVDGMAIFVRRDILDRVAGWPINKPYGYYLYAEWLCCEVRRQGYRIRLVGIDALHLGGKSSGHIAASPTYEEAHRYLYENNRDVLPYRVPE